MTDTYELPELPEPDMSHQKAVDDYDEETSYSAEALQEYARLAVKAERERCAKLVEAQKFWEVAPELAELAAQGDVMTAVLNHSMYGPVAAAIRKG